jgi:hypothetical protein
MGYEVRPDANWGLFERYLREFPQIAAKFLRMAMDQSVRLVESNVKPITPVGVSGRLRNSIGSQVIQEGPISIIGKIGSSLKDEEYPATMEFGRKPGTGVPPENLERWVHLQLGVPSKDARRVAGAVARSIAQNGIKAREFMKKGWEKSVDRVNGFFGEALTKIAEAIKGS